MERTPWMQSLMTAIYPQVAIEAIRNGFDGCAERVVARALQNAVAAGNSEAEVILQSAGGDYLKAAYLITSSKIPENAENI